jgi:hypothetical protein
MSDAEMSSDPSCFSIVGSLDSIHGEEKQVSLGVRDCLGEQTRVTNSLRGRSARRRSCTIAAQRGGYDREQRRETRLHALVRV